MGFTERLREQKAQRAGVSRSIDEENRRQAAIIEQRREIEAAAEMQRQIQRSQEMEKARGFFSQSAFPEIAQQMEDLVDGLHVHKRPIDLDREKPFLTGVMIKNHYDQDPGADYAYLDGVVGFTLIWRTVRNKEIRTGFWRRQIGVTPEEIYRAITVSCNATGTIAVNSSVSDITLAPNVWIGNPSLQEQSLERAFDNPREFVFNLVGGVYRDYEQFRGNSDGRGGM